MKKTVIWIAAAVAALPLQAQKPSEAQKKGDLNREMEVTREYEPTVDAASKLGVKPNMIDTVALRPEVAFSVTARPIDQSFDLTPIKPVQVSLDGYRRLTPLYLKVGVGAPLQSVLDAYYSSTQKTDGKWGAYVNHYGSWSDRDNFNGVKTPAAETFNRVGAFGEHRFGRFGISGELGYEYDKVSRYGYDTLLMSGDRPDVSDRVPMDASAAALRQNFSTVHGRVVFGHSFEDLSYFNVRFGVGAAYFQDHFDMKQTDLSPFLDLGKRFGGLHEVTLHVGYDYYKGGGKLDAVHDVDGTWERSLYKDQILTVSPLYRLRGERAEFALGVTYALDNDGYRSEGALFPQFEFRWNPAGGGFVPYLKVDGRYLNNGYRNTVARNPYVWQGALGKNTAEYNGRVGIRGGISSSFAYHVFGGYSRYRNMNVFMNVFDEIGGYLGGNAFDMLSLDASMWTVGGEIEGRISSSFGAELAVQYRWYDTKDRIYYSRAGQQHESPYYFGLPSLTAGVALKYHYKDKFSFKIGADVLGPRDFLDQLPSYFETRYVRQHAGMQVDVHLEAEYNISKTIGIFLEGRNLANQKMFYYNQYQALGINALAGVKLQF